MGVHGLWEIVAPAACPVNLDNMCDQRLAIDASIWIYHFLKAMRDSEGQVLHHAHVIGFFRRICKLIFFGIRPVFVFDGGAPALKRNTIRNRKERRKNREMTAKETAQKILTLQLHRKAESEVKKRKQVTKEDSSDEDDENVVYFDEVGKSVDEKHSTKTGKLVNPAIAAASGMTSDEIRIKKASDPYFLPEMDTDDIMKKIKPNDPRIMTQEELDEFEKELQSQQHSGLFDETVHDFESPAFKNLPIATQYQLLSTARLRSRLRMGLTADELEKEFPDRLDFSKFQIERVRQRNFLTQSLMNLAENENTDGDVKTVRKRVAGAKGREYLLQKRENGWALAFENDGSDKPIVIDDDTELRDSDLDEMQRKAVTDTLNKSNKDSDEDEDIEWEDVIPEIKQNNASDTKDKDFLESLPDSFKSFETNVQRAQLYQRLKDQANNSMKQPFLIEDDEQDTQTKSTTDETTQTQKRDEDTTTRKKIEEGSFSLGKSLFKKQRPQNKRELEGSSSDPKSQSSSIEKPHLNANSDTISSTKKPKSDYSSTQENQVPTDKNTKTDLTTPQSTTIIPPWFQQDVNATSADVQNIVSQSISAADADADLSRTYNHAPNKTFRKRTNSDVERSIEMELNNSHSEDSDLEMEGGIVPYSFILEHRREKENYGVQHDDHENKDTKDDSVIIEKVDRKNDQGDESVEIIEISSKDMAQKSINEADTLQNSKGDLPKTNKSEPEQTESSVPTSSYRNAALSTFKSFIPNFNSKKTTDNTGLSDSVAEEPKEISEEPTFDKDSATRDQDVEPPSQEKPKDLSEYELALALQEEEYNQQEDEALYESLAQELEETQRFTNSFKPQQILTSSGYSNSYKNQFSEPNSLPKFFDMPTSSYETELMELRRAAKKELRDADQVTPQMITDVQSLLQLFGIPYITAPMEAESQCSTLLQLDLVDGIVTDDSDTFLFGGTRVFKNMFSQKNSKYVECYDIESIEKEVGIKREEMIELAYLLGSDYTTGVTGVGPVTAMEILANFNSKNSDANNDDTSLNKLKNFKTWWLGVQSKKPNEQRIEPRDANFEKKFKKHVSRIFLPHEFPDPQVRHAYIKPEVDSDKTPFKWGSPDLDSLRKFLMQLAGWPSDKTDELLVPVIQKMNSRSTEKVKKARGLTDFFLAEQPLPGSGSAENAKGKGKPKKSKTKGKQLTQSPTKETAFEKRKRLTTLKGKSTRMKNAINLMKSGNMGPGNKAEEDLLSSSDEIESDGSIEEVGVQPSTHPTKFSEDYESSSDDDNDLPFRAASKIEQDTTEENQHTNDESVVDMVKEIRASKLAAASKSGAVLDKKKRPKKRSRKIKTESTSDNEQEIERILGGHREASVAQKNKRQKQ